jgi:hypothetical protein
MEYWNIGIMGSGIMQCWINGPTTGGIDDKIKMVNILLKTNIPSFHHSIIPFPGQIQKPQKTSIFSVGCRNSETLTIIVIFGACKCHTHDIVKYKFCRIKRYHNSVFSPKEIRHANEIIIPVRHEKSILEKSSIDIVSMGENNVFVFRPNFPECNEFENLGTLREMFNVNDNYIDAILYSVHMPK